MTNRLPIGILGSSITQFGELWDRSLSSLAEEACLGVIQDAGINPEEIDLVIVGNMASQSFTGQAHLGGFVSQLLPHHPPSWKVEAACASGGIATLTAVHALLSGEHSTALVLGVEKMTDCSTEETTRILAGAADLDQEPDATFPALYALLAEEYMKRYGATARDLASIAVKNHLHATRNPLAQFQKLITIEDVLKSPMVSEPLHLLDCSPISDGAAAIILSTKHHAPVELVGWGVGHDHLPIANRTHRDRLLATEKAMQAASSKSGLGPPDLELLELHDCFTIAEILAVEDLGFCEKGVGASWIAEHADRINTSGGLKTCGHPVGATGVKQIAWCQQQLLSTNHRTAITQNVGGSGGTAVVHHLQNKE